MFVIVMDSYCKVIHFIFVWSMVITRTADGGSITWHEPPPVETASDHNKELPANSRQILEGSTNVPLRWNFSLTADANPITLITVALDLNGVNVATIVATTGQVGTEPSFQGRYNVSWIPQVATVIIFNVSAEDNGEFGCQVSTFEGASSIVWKRKVTVEVVDPAVITHISGNQTVNETDVVTLNCSAEGMPTPNISWTRVSDNSPVFFPLTITGKHDEGGYRCTAENDIGNPASQVAYIIVENYHPIDTNLMTSLAGNSVVVNTSFNITCGAQANPPAKYKFYKDQNNFINDTTGGDVSVITTSVSERRKQVNYSCTPFNYFGDGLTDELTLTVLYAPDRTTLRTVPSNRTLLRDSTMSLNCEANASPEAEYHFFFNGKSIGNRTSGVFNVTVEADGKYTCVPINAVGTGDNVTVEVTAVDPPSITTHKITDTVEEGDNITLTCNASGKPQPIITWTKPGSTLMLSNRSSLTIVNVSRPGTPDNMIQYRCTASNGVGTPATNITTVTVHYAPDKTTLTTVPSNTTLHRGSNMTLKCKADASPEAKYHFYFNGTLIGNSSSGVFNTTVMADGVYTCVPINTVGTGDNATVSITAFVPESNSILVRLTVTNKGCDDNPSETCEQLRKKVEEEIKGHDGLNERLANVTEENCECGSVTAYLSLDFTENVKIPDVISVLKEAAAGNGFGELQVDPGSIQAISEEQLPTVSPSSSVATTTSEGDKDKGMLWIIIGASVGGAIVLIIVVAVVAWCVHHKRKCRRKGSKVRCSESEAFAPEEGNDYGHANNGYADAGPRPTAMEDMSQHQGASAVPTYAAVDKSAKKASKKDKKVEEEKPQAAPPEYAAVDKSKKKKKEEPEATYAEVDKSKKSKKKPKPGEVLYADLGDFHQMQELPAVSISPQALPPIKKPTPYGETQYADITQFLKGDATLPESNSSQGPGTRTQAAPAPEKSNSQEPGTSTKETSQASNPGGDGGPGHETNF